MEIDDGDMMLPPDYVNTPSVTTYDSNLPDAIFRTYVRVRGLAWATNYKMTPPITVEELAAVCHHGVRSIWSHLSELRRRGLISWRNIGEGQMIISLQKVAVLQCFASNNGAGMNVNYNHQQHQPAMLQKIAVTETERRVLYALVEYGVETDNNTVREIVTLSHVTPEFVHAWGKHLRGASGVRNLPGLLLYKLRTTTSYPPRENTITMMRKPPAEEIDDETLAMQRAALEKLRQRQSKR